MSATSEARTFRAPPPPGLIEGGRSTPPPPPRETVELSVAGGEGVQLLFVEFDARLYVLPSTPAGAWFSAAAREGEVVVRRTGGSRLAAPARVRDDPDLLVRLERLFDEKYGRAAWSTYFKRVRSTLEIAPGETLRPQDRLARIRGEFDAAAEGYDVRLGQNPVERYLKDRVADLAVRALDGLDPILEIGPGTGYHTVRLLAAGHHVTAVDISDGMLRRLRERVAGTAWQDRLETRRGSAAELEALVVGDGEASFAGVFTAFGALDVERDVHGVVRTLERVVRPGGRFVLTSLNRPGWGPFLWDLAMARPSAAGARLRNVIPAGRIRYPLALFPRTPSEWDRLLSPGFVRLSLTGVSVLAPPFVARRPLAFLGALGAAKLRRWDRWLTERRSAWAAAEWVFLTYRRLDPTLPSVAAAARPSRKEG